jgi:ATP-binding cassette, subfamily C, bacterial CydCD
MRDDLDALDAEVARHDRTSVLRGGGSDALVQLGLGLTAVGVVLVGVPAVGDGRLHGVVLGAVVVLALASIDAVGPLPTSARALVTAKVAAVRLREVLEGPLPVEEASTDGSVVAPRSPETGPELTVAHVSARYPTAPERAVVGIDLRIAPGQRVAVVGRSGAGKSTLASLVVRFLDPEEGTIRLDDTPIVHLPGDEVRRWITLAPQDGHIFDGTIESNLRLAAPDAALPALWAALGEAQLASWVAEQPAGLRTPVGERGSRLSGGQRHRLALARALVSPGPLLVVDEPTADLDPVTGRAFLRDLLGVGGRRGLLLFTHDLRALPVVDEVVVLESGRARARGRHQDLLRDPDYARWWDLETAGFPMSARSPSFPR